MSKERLEKIKKRLVLLHNAIDVDDETKNYIFEDLKVEWLIERVQELKKDRDALEIKIDKSYRDTHKYKQALELVEDELEYAKTTGNDEVRDMYIKNSIRFINEALEGEEWR